MKFLKLRLFPSSEGGSGATSCDGSDRNRCSEALDPTDVVLSWHTFS